MKQPILTQQQKDTILGDKPYVKLPDSDPNWCGLRDDPHFKQCCCNCIYRLPVFFNCSTNPKPAPETHKGKCVCNVQKGWACVHPEMGAVYDNWPEHSVGCELYTPKQEEKPERLFGNNLCETIEAFRFIFKKG